MKSSFLGILTILSLILHAGLARGQAGKALYLSFEQRMVVSYALLAQGQDPETQEKIFSRFTKLSKNIYEKGFQTIEVKNFQEFLEVYRGEWPNTNSLALDLEIIEQREARGFPKFVGPSPRIQKQIDQFIKDQTRQLIELAKTQKADAKGEGLLRDAGIKAVTGFVDSLVAHRGQLSKALMRGILSVSDTLIATQVDELNKIGEKIAQSKMAAEKDPSTKIMLETIFTEYFSGLSKASKKVLISSFLGADLRANDMQKFELMVQNSGPQLQKLLQVVARQGGLDAEMGKIFRKLESSVRKVPWVQVQALLAKEQKNFNFTYFEQKPLGVGSMAQVHRAKILINGQRKDVVVRFIKPGMDHRVQEDHYILTKIANILDNHPQLQNLGIPKMSPMVVDITRTVAEELNQNETIRRQVDAKSVYEMEIPIEANGYKNKLKVHVPEVYKAAGDSDFMVQEMVIGQKLDKEVAEYQKLLPDFKRVVTEKIATMWLQEVLFGSGFYHADLHQGNFLVRIVEPAPILTILDYGMTGRLSKDLQAQVIVLGAGLQALDAKMIFEAFWKISDQSKNTIEQSTFKRRVEAKVKDLKVGREPSLSMDLWVAWAMEQGIHPSYDFVNLNRGIAIVSKMLTEAGSLENIETLTQKLAKINPGVMYRALTVDAGLGLKGLTKLGLSQMKKTTPYSPAHIRCEAVFF